MGTRLAILCALAMSACVPPHVSPIQPLPVVTPDGPEPFVYDGHIQWFSSWLDSSPETARVTNAITIPVDCDDPDAVTKAQAILARDSRSVIWFAPMFAYGAEGYELRANASACWQREADLIRNNRARSIAVWLLDEPPDVAWSFWVDNGTRYDPNRYNEAIRIGSQYVHGDFADLATAYNFGSLPAGAVVAEGPSIVGLESYDDGWQAKLRKLEALTPLPIWLMPPAFVDGDPLSADPILAQRVRDQWTAMQHDPRVTGAYFFLFCCDDLVTGNRSFYTVGGGSLPLTWQALKEHP